MKRTGSLVPLTNSAGHRRKKSTKTRIRRMNALPEILAQDCGIEVSSESDRHRYSVRWILDTSTVAF